MLWWINTFEPYGITRPAARGYVQVQKAPGFEVVGNDCHERRIASTLLSEK